MFFRRMNARPWMSLTFFSTVGIIHHLKTKPGYDITGYSSICVAISHITTITTQFFYCSSQHNVLFRILFDRCLIILCVFPVFIDIFSISCYHIKKTFIAAVCCTSTGSPSLSNHVLFNVVYAGDYATYERVKQVASVMANEGE